ncbi:MAG: hypothetical protein ACE5HE_08915 [Phycisphaerae bacterium]
MARHHTLLRATLGTMLLPAVGACPAPAHRVRLDPIPMRDAVDIVNHNQSMIRDTLRASGTADGYFTSRNGRRRHFRLDATMFVLGPACFRLDLKKFGDRQLLVGSNAEWYWYYSKQDDAYTCGRRGAEDIRARDLPVHPDQIVDALGLGGIDSGPGPTTLVQRIEADHQQLLLISTDDEGVPVLEKEYWIDRFTPRLVGRVMFRDPSGGVDMQSDLGEYRRLGLQGPWLPHVIRVYWPKSQALLRLDVGKWMIVDEVKADSVQFAVPQGCYAQ